MILGTQYAGEMKKGLFAVMHYLMPKRGILCTAHDFIFFCLHMLDQNYCLFFVTVCCFLLCFLLLEMLN